MSFEQRSESCGRATTTLALALCGAGVWVAGVTEKQTTRSTKRLHLHERPWPAEGALRARGGEEGAGGALTPSRGFLQGSQEARAGLGESRLHPPHRARALQPTAPTWGNTATGQGNRLRFTVPSTFTRLTHGVELRPGIVESLPQMSWQRAELGDPLGTLYAQARRPTPGGCKHGLAGSSPGKAAIRTPSRPIAPRQAWLKTRSGGICGAGCKARPLARACAVARAGLAALGGAGGGPSEADVRHAGVSLPGGGGRRLQPPCWMPQIRHNLAGSFLKKIKIKSEASAGRTALSVGTGGCPEEPQAFFFLRGGGVAMETRAAGERGRGWGWGWRGGGVGRGARPPAAGGPEEARRLRGGGGIRVPGRGAHVAASLVGTRRRWQYPAALGFFIKKKKKCSKGAGGSGEAVFARARAVSRTTGGPGARASEGSGGRGGGSFESRRCQLLGFVVEPPAYPASVSPSVKWAAPLDPRTRPGRLEGTESS